MGILPSQVRTLINSSYAIYGIAIVIFLVVFLQPVSGVAYNLMGGPEAMIGVLFVAGLGIASLYGTSMMKGTMLNSSGGKYFIYAMALLFFITVVLAAVSFSMYGYLAIIIGIIISGISFIAFFFQKKSMF